MNSRMCIHMKSIKDLIHMSNKNTKHMKITALLNDKYDLISCWER